ncbi:hypothetical protein [Almyronema epifaneia]|uniref:Uncharacterized protein n=1 Tax=Almyronema epifaneia S1 TaxID=2991925 RepID=A0ABW6I9B5_9CYAN
MFRADPHYPRIILSFVYRGYQIQVEQEEANDQVIYSAWANYAVGCAVAVPIAYSRSETIRRAKLWVDRRCQ